jgi:hypothetical protein
MQFLSFYHFWCVVIIKNSTLLLTFSLLYFIYDIYWWELAVCSAMCKETSHRDSLQALPLGVHKHYRWESIIAGLLLWTSLSAVLNLIRLFTLLLGSSSLSVFWQFFSLFNNYSLKHTCGWNLRARSISPRRYSSGKRRTYLSVVLLYVSTTRR